MASAAMVLTDEPPEMMPTFKVVRGWRGSSRAVMRVESAGQFVDGGRLAVVIHEWPPAVRTVSR